MTLDTVFRLGRVSNLPTVWSNGLAGLVLSGAAFGVGTAVFVALILSLFYVGGMWLNDAFDAEIDARERKARPIPAGEIGSGTVFVTGGALLGAGAALGLSFGAPAAVAGLMLAALVVLYDWCHKRTALAPLVMGGTRFFCYVFAAAAAGTVGVELGGTLLVGAAGLFAYVVGLTFAARQEAFDRIERVWPLAVLFAPLVVAVALSGLAPLALALCAALAAVMAFSLRLLFRRNRGDVPRAVVALIAGIPLYDAALIAGAGQGGLGLLAAAAFPLTLALQRLAPGT